MSFQQIQKYENGSNRISVSRLMMICEALGCRASDIIASLEPEAAGEALDEVGLAGAEVAVEGEDVAGREVRGEALAEGEGVLGRGGFGGEEGVERVIRPHHPLGRSVTTGSSISSRLTPPCWNVSWYWLR